MREIHPGRRDLELDDLYDDLRLKAGEERAHIAVGMVSSVDGAASVNSATANLGGDGDRIAFQRLRDASDAVLVGAGTVRAESYGPGTLGARRRERRRRAGLAPSPRMVVVSESLRLDPAHAIFTGPVPPLLVTHARARSRASEGLADVAEIVVVGEDRVDLVELARQLAVRELRRVLCEGGPTLNHALLTEDLVDELFVTVAPQLVGGAAPRIFQAATGDRVSRLRLVSVHEHEGELLLRYVRAGP